MPREMCVSTDIHCTALRLLGKQSYKSSYRVSNKHKILNSYCIIAKTFAGV